MMGSIPYTGMGHTVIEDVEDRVDDSVIQQKIIKTEMTHSTRAATDTRSTTATRTVVAPSSGTTTKTKPRNVTSATRPKRRPKSSFQEWWHFVIDSSTKSTSYHDY